jgi:hypothetical protein
MALRFCDSFDHYATADFALKGWTTGGGFGSGPQVVAAAARTGTNGVRSNSASAAQTFMIRSVSAASGTTAIIGYARKYATVAVQELMFSFRLSGTVQFTLYQNTDGSMTAYRGGGEASTPSGGTSLGSSAASVLTTGSQYIELKVVIDTGTSGSFEVRINGANVLSATGINTAGAGSSGWNSFRLGIFGSAAGDGLDDFYVCDGSGSYNNDFLGDIKVECKVASSGDGSNADWTPSTGTDNGAMVDEASYDGDTTYNSSSTVSQKDTYNFAALSSTGAVKAVQHGTFARKTDAGLRAICSVARHSGVDYDGSNVYLGTTYTAVLRVMEENPGTAAPWTIAGVDGAEFGQKVTV